MTNFNERTNTLLYKNIIYHTLFLKGWCWLCVRDELETGTKCYFDPSSSRDHSSTSFASWLGCSTVGHWGPPDPLSASWFSRWHLVSNWLRPSVRLVILLFNVHLLPLFFAYLHRCISWLTTRSRVNLWHKVIHWELCKKFKFDYTNKWYMHIPESVREKEKNKILWDFETNGSPNLSLTTRLNDSQHTKKKKKREPAE